MRFYRINHPDYNDIGPLPSVTTVLSQTYNKGRYGELVPGSSYANNVKFRADVGTAVHKMVECALLGEAPPAFDVDVCREAEKLFEQVWPIVKGLKIFRGPSGNLAIEKFVYSVRLMVGGRIDFVVEAPDGSLEVWDIKTAGSKRKADQIKGYFLQAAAYAQCLTEITGRQVNTCRLLFAYAIRDKDRNLTPYSEEMSIEGAALEQAKLEFGHYRDEFQRLSL